MDDERRLETTTEEDYEATARTPHACKRCHGSTRSGHTCSAVEEAQSRCFAMSACWGVHDQGCDESLDEVFLSPPTSRPHLPVVYLWASLRGLLRTLGGVFDAFGRLLGAIWEHVVSVYACSGVSF